jgi:hypothetical protein
MDNQKDLIPEETGYVLSNDAVGHITETRKWTMFFSILGFAFMVITVLIVIVAALAGRTYPIQGFNALMLIPLLLICSIYFFPIYFLFKFSLYSKQALKNKNNESLSIALKYLKMHYRFMGIFFIVVVCIYLIAIIIAIVTGSFTHMFHS